MGMLLVSKRRKNKTVIDTTKTDFNNMTVADLKNYAEENSIDINGATKKSDIINAIIGDTNGQN